MMFVFYCLRTKAYQSDVCSMDSLDHLPKVSEKILFNFPKVLQLSSTNIKNLTLIEQIDYLSEIEADSALSIDSVLVSPFICIIKL